MSIKIIKFSVLVDNIFFLWYILNVRDSELGIYIKSY